ncbi:MAG TPA: hypothetical protein VK914_10690 [bacterium]|jgi:hypothetical protein|nr:hypothetical protein [bacterium]
MKANMKTLPRNATQGTQDVKAAQAGGLETLLGQALASRSSGRHERALDLLRQAAVRDLRRPEPWYWIGRIQEELHDSMGAAYSYFMSRERGRYEPASVALRRMGHLPKES